MKYYSTKTNTITVSIKPGFWSSANQASFIARRLAWFMDRDKMCVIVSGETPEEISFNGLSYIEALTSYLRGSRCADLVLRRALTPAEFRIVSEVADFLTNDPSGSVSGKGSAYLAADLNTGRNLVLIPRRKIRE